MDHFKRNINQALEVSNQLHQAATQKMWDKLEALIEIRDKTTDIAFPENLPEALYEEARRAFSIIKKQHDEVTELSKEEAQDQKKATIASKRGRQSVQSYLD